MGAFCLLSFVLDWVVAFKSVLVSKITIPPSPNLFLIQDQHVLRLIVQLIFLCWKNRALSLTKGHMANYFMFSSSRSSLSVIILWDINLFWTFAFSADRYMLDGRRLTRRGRVCFSISRCVPLEVFSPSADKMRYVRVKECRNTAALHELKKDKYSKHKLSVRWVVGCIYASGAKVFWTFDFYCNSITEVCEYVFCVWVLWSWHRIILQVCVWGRLRKSSVLLQDREQDLRSCGNAVAPLYHFVTSPPRTKRALNRHTHTVQLLIR